MSKKNERNRVENARARIVEGSRGAGDGTSYWLAVDALRRGLRDLASEALAEAPDHELLRLKAAALTSLAHLRRELRTSRLVAAAYYLRARALYVALGDSVEAFECLLGAAHCFEDLRPDVSASLIDAASSSAIARADAEGLTRAWIRWAQLLGSHERGDEALAIHDKFVRPRTLWVGAEDTEVAIRATAHASLLSACGRPENALALLDDDVTQAAKAENLLIAFNACVARAAALIRVAEWSAAEGELVVAAEIAVPNGYSLVALRSLVHRIDAGLRS